MKILLTGPFGNVGSNVVDLVLTSNAATSDAAARITLTCLAKKSPLSEANYRTLAKSKAGKQALQDGTLIIIWGNLTIEEDIKRAVAGQDAVIHLGAVIPPLAYIDPALAEKVNVGGTKLLLDACNSAPQPPRFIYASSYSVNGPKNPHKELPLLDSNTPLNPKDSYGKHKVECEQYIRQAYKGEWCILRLGAVSVTFKNMKSVTPSPQLDIITNGIPANQRRHGVHSKDVALACVNAAKPSTKVHGKTLMIGGDDSWKVTNEVFLKHVLQPLGISYPMQALRVPPKDADDAFYYEDWMDTTEAQQLLDFHKHTIQDWTRELKSEVGVGLRTLLRSMSPLVKFFLARKSMHYKYNHRGERDPNADKTMAQLVVGGGV